MLFIAFFTAMGVLMVSCTGHARQSMQELEAVDAMLDSQQVKAALNKLQNMDASKLDDECKAYHTLLMTLAIYKNYMPFDNDTAISQAVKYYKERDKRKYMRALIAQGCANEDIGNLDKAVMCYHHAEEITDVDDTASLAYAKLRLAYLYQSQVIGTFTLALKKYKEALPMYQKLGDKHYELVCKQEIGGIYRSIDGKHDSAVLYLNQALELAKTDSDPYYLFSIPFMLSEYYLVREQDYRAAIRYGHQALAVDETLIEHPRAHYRVATSYLQLGQLDSALYFINHAPRPAMAVDSVSYFEVMSQVEHFKHNELKSKDYFILAHDISDSLINSGLNHRLLAVEKKYDLQQDELHNARLQSRLRGTWLLLAIIIITALLLGLGLLHYRHRLRLKEQEQQMLRADLDQSLAGLQHMQEQLTKHEQQLHACTRALREQLAAQEVLAQERERLAGRIAEFEGKKRQSDELRAIITSQIESVHQLMRWSYELKGEKFANKFREVMTLPSSQTDQVSYWSNLHALVNDLYDGLLYRAQQKAGGTLNESELNLLALYRCGFSRTVIMVCMGYQSVGTVYNKINQITRKLNVIDLNAI